MRIATMVAASRERLHVEAALAAPYADLLELRIDLLQPADRQHLEEILRRLPAPTVAACRRPQDGGRYEGGEEDRIALLRRAVAAGAEWVDVEMGSPAAAALAGEVRHCLISHHDLRATPADLQEVASRLRGTAGARMAKLVTRASTLQDNLALRDVLSRRGPIPLIAFCTGEAGRASRLLARAWGSAGTYGSAGNEPAAPGQMSVREMVEVYGEGSHRSRTRLAGVVGWPLGHSLSPFVHNAAYREMELDWLYLPLPCEEASDAIRFARALGLRGLSVTRPHKVSIREHLSALDPVAEGVGAVNTVLLDGAQARGENTDVEGGVAPLRRRLALRDVPVAILGAGGAARALAHGLRDEGARVAVFARRPEAARALASSVGGDGATIADLPGYRWEILVNATPVGASPDADESPVPADWLRGSWVCDIVYRPRRTRLLREARARGLGIVEGLEMFVGQAEEQFRRFTGRTPPPGTMHRVAAGVLAEEEAG